MIRKALFCLLIIFPLITQAQKFKRGSYAFSGGFVGQKLTIGPSGKFDYINWSCTHIVRGRGHYLLSHDTLTLIFEGSHSSPCLPRIKRMPSKNSVSSVNLRFGFNNLKPVSNSEVIIKILKDKKVIGGTVAENRTTTIQISNTNLPVVLNFSSIQFSGQMQINEPGNYEVIYPLADNISLWHVEGDSAQFIVSAFSKKQITLCPVDNTSSPRTLYRRNNRLLSLFHRPDNNRKRKHEVTNNN